MSAFWQLVASNALVAAALAVGVALLGRVWKNPSALHLLWVLVLLKLVTPPLWQVPLPVAGTEPAASGVVRPQPEEPPLAVATQATELPAHRATDRRPTEAAPVMRDVSSPQPAVPPAARPSRISWPVLLGGSWALGIAGLGLVRLACIGRFQRLLRAAQEAPPPLQRRAEAVARRLELPRLPELLLVPLRLSPMVWSWGGRPRLILPAALFAQLDAEAQELILAHELAHVRRKDHWVRLLELGVTTVFWWHPVAWWACRRLRALEEECCDRLVVDSRPHQAKRYALALLETLDFLSQHREVAPWGATAAASAGSLTRRIQMLRRGNAKTQLGKRHLFLLAAVAVVPMAIAFAAETPPAKDKIPASAPATADPPLAVQRRAVRRLVKDFPEPLDLSTPETAAAACNRAMGHMDAPLWAKTSWWPVTPQDLECLRQREGKALAIDNQAQLDAEILEVLSDGDDLAEVVLLLKFPEGVGRDPYSSHWFGRIDGVWRNLGADRLPSLEAAWNSFGQKKESIRKQLTRIREAIQAGRPVTPEAINAAEQPPAAPIPLEISAEKAELMGRVEYVTMHGGYDITARKTIEWGDVEKDTQGNRSIRYKYYATIWDREVMIFNQVFTFDAKGNFLRMEHVPGYPQKKVEKPIDLTTQAGLQALVEKAFRQGLRDISRRHTLEWGEPTPASNGQVSIRYKYRARQWDKVPTIMNHIFTFDAQGALVSLKDVEGFPQTLPQKPIDLKTQAGLQDRVEDFFDHNYGDIQVRETLEWGEPLQSDNGTHAIRCKYQARIGDGEPQVFDKLFTFDAQGGFVSVADVAAK